MSIEVWAMMAAGIAALAAGLVLARPRFQAAYGAGKTLVLGPVFEAAALAVFSAEHFTAARDLMTIVPRWLPYPLFWTYFVGACLLAAAVSFISMRHVRWSASLLALLFLIIVATIDLPNLPRGPHTRFFWILTVREMSFAGGAMALAGSVWPSRGKAGAALTAIGRTIVAAVMIFYGIEHFLYPRFVTGVPLEKPTPAWMPTPVFFAYMVGLSLVLAGLCLLIAKFIRVASAVCGSVLMLLTVFFYGSILAVDIRTAGNNSALMVEDLNYIFDTILFAATVLLAGLGREPEPTAANARDVARDESALTSR
jgi:uncharacterized membrane protein